VQHCRHAGRHDQTETRRNTSHTEYIPVTTMHDTEQCDCVSELQLNIDQMLSCEWIQFKNKNDIINKVLPAAYNLEKKL